MKLLSNNPTRINENPSTVLVELRRGHERKNS